MAETVQLFIRTDGDGEIGLGHLYRCLALADQLEANHGFGIQFLIGRRSRGAFAGLSTRQAQVLEEGDGGAAEAMEVAARLRRGGAQGLLTDSYLQEGRFYETLRGRIPTVPVLAIDDGGEKADFPVAGFINFGLGADERAYPAWLRRYSAVGPAFFPLRPGLAGRSRREADEARPVRRILVTMGGSDPEGQTLRVVRLLKELEGIDAVDVVLGPAYRSADAITGEVAADGRFVLHRDPPDLAAVMRRADLAVTGGGTTCGELLYLGVPVAVLVLADNQEASARAIADRGWGHRLGRFDALSDAELGGALRGIIADPVCLSRLAAAGSRVLDGNGGARLAAFIAGFLAAYHGDSFTSDAVQREYDEAASAPDEYAKVKWGSPEGMHNRFRLAKRVIDWSSVRCWLDVGCGTGAFLAAVEGEARIVCFLGLDLSPALIAFARSRAYRTPEREFRCQHFLDGGIGEGGFDLVTAIGVLQKCGVSLRKAVARFAELVRPGGQVFVTTKNRGWKRFEEPGFVPYPGHHWFEPEEIRAAFTLAGLEVLRMEGFEPRSVGTTCPPEEAHSLYVLAKKTHADP